MSEITQILGSIRAGEADSLERLLSLVYEELRAIAARQMAQHSPGHTLQATSLVHDAWHKIVGAGNYDWESRRHFFNTAAQAMRQVLTDAARRRRAARHGGHLERVGMEGIELPQEMEDGPFLDIQEALDRFTREYPRKAELVRLKFFIGLTNDEAAEILGVSLRSVERDWAFARTWLRVEVQGRGDA